MPYKLRDRLTQEEWFERQRNGEMTDAEIERARAAGSESWCIDDLTFLHEIGALDWSLADSLMFQGFISAHGSPEEQAQLESLQLGFRRPTESIN